MNYNDLLTLIIIFLIVLTLGLRLAEEGVYSTMGIDKRPTSFDFYLDVSDRHYELCFLGNTFSLKKTFKIANFYADRRMIIIKTPQHELTLYTLIPTGLKLNSGVNLDKKSAKMYN